MFDINDAVIRYRDARKQRLELESIANDLKEKIEKPLSEEIIVYLTNQGLQNAKTEHGTVGKRITRKMQIADVEVACRAMLQDMKRLEAEGKPLVDALLFQKTAHKGLVEEIVLNAMDLDKNEKYTDEEFNAVAQNLGMRIVSEVGLSLTASK